MEIALVLLTYLTGTYLTSASASTCTLSPLYPHGIDRGDTAIAEGDDQYFNIALGYELDFYGRKYSSLYLDVNGVISFTKPVTISKALKTPFRTPYFTPFWTDINIEKTDGGVLLYRKVNINQEADLVTLVENDLAASGYRLVPEMIVMFTWKEVKKYDGPSDVNNTFQVVLVSDRNRTITIFNYGLINWWKTDEYAGIIFNKGDGTTQTEYAISLKDEVANVADYSNVGFPGRIVTRIDGNIQLGKLTRYNCSSCIADRASGNITTFDGSAQLNVHMANRKYLLSKEYANNQADQNDQCKYMLKITTDGDSQIEWVTFIVGANLKWNFAFERYNKNTVEIRSRQLKKITTFPYYGFIQDNGQRLFVVIEKVAGGWVFRSTTCQYYLVYRPRDESQQLRLFLGPYYQNKVFAMCQNNNNDATDDRKKCSMPPEDVVGDDFVTVIGDSCSCPRANKKCTRVLNRL